MSGKRSKKNSATDWDFLKTKSDHDIDFSDIPELGDGFWNTAELWLPKTKESVTLRLDRDVLDWFRGTGRGYQTRINAVLKSYVQAVIKAER